MALEGTPPLGIPGQPHRPRTARASVESLAVESVAVPRSVEENAPQPVDQAPPTPSLDLQQLLADVHQASPVRQEVIGEIARRLAQGEFLTPQAAERTVQALLHSRALE
jgi:hypothetical protein